MRRSNLMLALALVLSTTPALSSATADTVEELQDELNPFLVEIQPNPEGDDRGEEWIELANPTPRPLDLDGFYLTDHEACLITGQGWVHDYHWPLNGTVPPEGRLVIQLPVNCIRLANQGDDLELLDEDGRVLQNVTYGEQGDVPSPEPGQSIQACQRQHVPVHGAFELAPETRDAPNQPC